MLQLLRNTVSHSLRRFGLEEDGAALVEYGMLVGLIAVICVLAVTGLGKEVSSAFSYISASLENLGKPPA